jgi:outer membrane protein assembly factor BamE (lipoprotein component of BamABCDE complex)
MKKRALLLFSALAALTACEPTIANRGSMLDPETLAQITPGTTTREEVAQKLGTPTALSTFDENVWYYVGRQTEQYSFLSPKVIEQKAVEVDFDDKGIVTALTNLDLSEAADASPVDRATPTFGQKNSLLRELIGDMTHPLPDLKNQRRGSGT